MTKIQMGVAAAAAAVLAFGVAACGQTTTVEEAPAEVTEPAAAPAEAPADPAAAPADPAAAPAEGTTTPPATTP